MRCAAAGRPAHACVHMRAPMHACALAQHRHHHRRMTARTRRARVTPDRRMLSGAALAGNPGPTGQGSVLFGADGEPLRERLGNIGRQTNNVSEYVAFQNALELALEECGEGGQVLVLGDSKLVLNQVTGVWQVSKPHLLPYRDRCQRLLKRFRTVAVSHVRREFNSHADAVANEALDAGESSAIDRDATVSTRLRLPPDVEADFRALQQGA